MYNIFLNTKVYARIFTEERSRIFVKEPEGSSEKTLKYVKCTYVRIFVPSQKNKFMIYACTIFLTFKLIELERYGTNRTVKNKFKRITANSVLTQRMFTFCYSYFSIFYTLPIRMYS